MCVSCKFFIVRLFKHTNQLRSLLNKHFIPERGHDFNDGNHVKLQMHGLLLLLMVDFGS